MGKKILIVEDEQISAKILKQFLIESGYEVCDIVTTGEDSIIAALKHNPDLITMDIKLAGKLDGIEAACEIIKKSTIPFVFLTAIKERSFLAKIKNLPVYGYIIKPFSKEEIQTSLDLAFHLYNKNENQRNEAEKMHLIMDIINEGVFEWDIPTNSYNISKSWYEILGFENIDVTDRYKFWEDNIHPEDKPRVLKQLKNHLSGKTEKFISDYRIKTPDGTYSWILNRSKVVKRDLNSKPLKMIGTHTNINERKLSEEKLEKLLNELEWNNIEMHSANSKLQNEIELRMNTEKILKARTIQLTNTLKNLEDSYKKLKQSQEEIIALEKRNSALAMAVTANHELNQPLMILQANLDMFRLSCTVTKMTDKQEKYMQNTQDAIDRITKIINSFKESNNVSFEDYSGETSMAILSNDKNS